MTPGTTKQPRELGTLELIARWIVAALAISASIALLVLAYLSERGGPPSNYVEVTGEVIHIEATTTRSGQTANTDTDTLISFADVDSVEYTFRSEYGSGSTRHGDQVTVAYDPAWPPGTAETQADRNAANAKYVYPLIGLVPLAIVALAGTKPIERIGGRSGAFRRSRHDSAASGLASTGSTPIVKNRRGDIVAPIIAVAVAVAIVIPAAVVLAVHHSNGGAEARTIVSGPPPPEETTPFGAEAATFAYPDFSSVDGLTLVGSAEPNRQELLLTTLVDLSVTNQTQTGAAWYVEKVAVEDGFETTFAFQLEMYSWSTVGEGIVFVIQNSEPAPLADEVSRMGYGGIPNSVAVEFDATSQGFLGDPVSLVPGAPTLMGNHISVHTEGTDPNTTNEKSSIGLVNLTHKVMANREVHLAHITYVPGELRIYVDEIDTPVLTVDINLADTLRLDDGSAYVGFTAATVPGIFTAHKLLAWELVSATPTS